MQVTLAARFYSSVEEQDAAKYNRCKFSACLATVLSS